MGFAGKGYHHWRGRRIEEIEGRELAGRVPGDGATGDPDASGGTACQCRLSAGDSDGQQIERVSSASWSLPEQLKS